MTNLENLQPMAGSRNAVAANELLLGEPDSPGGSVGDLLKQARDKSGLSLGDVAARLRMGVKQVRALEENDYSSLPTGTFLRGFVRNFAKEVGLKPEHALALLEKTHQAAVPISASAVVMPSQQNINVPTPGGDLATPRTRVVIAALIALLVLIVVWWWWEYVKPYLADGGRPKNDNAEKLVSVPIAVPEQTSIAPPAEPLPATVSIPPPALQADAQPALAALPSTKSTPSQAIVAMPVPTPPVATPATIVSPSSSPRIAESAINRVGVTAGNGLLGLTFMDNSWVQVVDANGKTVIDRTFKGGDAEEISGKAPFSVVIGNARVTRLAFNGKEIDLAPHTRASVARVTVK
jgi:cytoskeleton protein RodZ